LGKAYQASNDAFDFRQASNVFLRSRDLSNLANPLILEQLTEGNQRSSLRPMRSDVGSAGEKTRGEFEQGQLAAAKLYAGALGLTPTEYVRAASQFGRVAGFGQKVLGQEELFPTAGAVSQVTGANVDLLGRLAQVLVRGGALAGGTRRQFGGFAPAAQVDRMAMLPFVQAIRDGLNESDATEVLENIARQTIRGAQMGVGSNAFAANMLLGGSLAKAGLSPETAYKMSGGIGAKAQSLAFGAQSARDLRFLQFFGGLDLSQPIAPSQYNQAIEKAAQQKYGPNQMQRYLRSTLSQMGGNVDAAAAGVAADFNAMVGQNILSIPEARRLLERVAQGQPLQAADLKGLGQTPTAMMARGATTSAAETTRADTRAAEIESGLKLVDTFTKLDAATARAVESVALFKDDLDGLSTMIEEFGEKMGDILQALAKRDFTALKKAFE
jgi:hypothetical protein